MSRPLVTCRSLHAWYWHPRGWRFRWRRVELPSGSLLVRQFGPWRSFSRYRGGDSDAS